MRKIRIVLLSSLVCVGLHAANAEKAPEVIKKVVKVTSELQNYDIRFEKYFKLTAQNDTLKEVYHSMVYQSDMGTIGWHRIFQWDGMILKSLVANNTMEMARLNLKDMLYYVQKLQEDEKKAARIMQSNMYYPFTMSRDDYNGFEVSKDDKKMIWLERTDTVKDAAMRVKAVNKTAIGINPKTYIPEVEESWTTFPKGGVQYSKYLLIDYHVRPANGYASVLKSSDSLLRHIKSFTNGDSLKNTKKKFYKQVKIGDSAFVFSGTLYGDNKAFKLSDIKDSIVVLDFFFTTCKPCVASVPEINRIYNLNKTRGVTVVGIDAFANDWANLDAFMAGYGVNYSIVKTQEDIKLEYGVTAFPRMFILKNGRIARIFYGAGKDVGSLLQKNIDELMKGQ